MTGERGSSITHEVQKYS